MRSLSVIGGCALIVLSAVAAGYVAGEPLSSVVPVVIVLAIFWALSRGTITLRHARQRSTDLALSRVERLFDYSADPGAKSYPGMSHVFGRVDGREAEFLFWLPSENPPDVPAWQQTIWAASSSEDGGPCPAFGFRLSCWSPVTFQVKKWGVLPGPPFEEVKLDAVAIGNEPVEFTTATMEAFTLWHERRDCRQLAERLILECGVLQVSVTPSDITAWWPADGVGRWTGFARVLPLAVETVAELAHALDGRPGSADRGGRKCARCGADITRYQAFCATCGNPWWEPTPAPPQTPQGDARAEG